MGVIVLIGAAYGFLKEFGVTEWIKKVIGGIAIAWLLSLAVGVLLEWLFKADFHTVSSISFWVFLAFMALKVIFGVCRR